VKDLARAAQVTPEEAHAGVEFIRTLDPRPGAFTTASRRGSSSPTWSSSSAAGVGRGHERGRPAQPAPQPRYRRMLVAEGTDKEVKDYVKERFRSAMQLMRNIAQRKSTILRTCEVIVRRQQEFLDKGVEACGP
jgi:RNA polymerase sigma-54 factor